MKKIIKIFIVFLLVFLGGIAVILGLAGSFGEDADLEWLVRTWLVLLAVFCGFAAGKAYGRYCAAAGCICGSLLAVLFSGGFALLYPGLLNWRLAVFWLFCFCFISAIAAFAGAVTVRVKELRSAEKTAGE